MIMVGDMVGKIDVSMMIFFGEHDQFCCLMMFSGLIALRSGGMVRRMS